MNTYEKYEKLLQERGITSYQVAKDTGIAESVLSSWKIGRSNPKLDKLLVLCKYFDVQLDYFVGDDDDG